MKKFSLVCAILFATIGFAWAQTPRFAFVDTEYILSNIPEFEQAQTEIETLSQTWQKEIEKQYSDLDAMYKNFQIDAPLLTQENRTRREDEIVQKERQIKELQKKRFGNDGDLFKKREEMIRPIQDKIFTAIEKRSAAKSYNFVFDRTENASIMFADPKLDISNDILEEMGYSTKDKKNKINVSAGVEVQSKPNEISKTVRTGN